MEQGGLLSPLLWAPMDAVDDFAPSDDWDALMGSLATLARNVFMKKLSYEGSIKSLQGCRDFLNGSPKHLVRQYWAPLKHLVDATWVLLTCLHLGRSVEAVIFEMRGGLERTHGMSPEEQSALAASKSITLQLCHY
ncbi:uncharacterized protein LOC127751645, partial [Frankliniella occidentalis]|uniref:Uncharacterized protein LOC127751645 n=1 Tax=Frankliniella occidentalis TaxID=133901 RepID=A0A9C6XUU1_FRAOC